MKIISLAILTLTAGISFAKNYYVSPEGVKVTQKMRKAYQQDL
jgi:hypothetical protein